MIDPRSCHREFIKIGMNVSIALSDEDREDDWIEGVVKYILTPNNVNYDKNGIKVRISDGTIGHTKKILDAEELNENELKKIIQGGETSKVEFKETFKVAAGTNEELKCLRDEVVKEIAAFMNTTGGLLLIGVDDSDKVVGLEPDYKFIIPHRETQPKQDKLKQEIRSYVKEKLHDETLESDYDIMIKSVDAKEICAIKVYPSNKPVFVNQKILFQRCGENNMVKSQRHNFYIRTDSGTQMLDSRKIFEHWNSKNHQ